jgi:hypothetical protein
MTPTPFRLQIPAESLHDLRRRLSQARYPDTAPGEPWACGTDVDYMQTLLAYWRDQFDWRAQEARLNALPQFKVQIGDADVHFLHVPIQPASVATRTMPLRSWHPHYQASGFRTDLGTATASRLCLISWRAS